MQNIIEIKQTIAEHLGFPAEELDLDARLREDLGLGPLELNDLLTEISKKFDMTFSSTDVEDIKTMGDLLVLVEDNLIE